MIFLSDYQFSTYACFSLFFAMLGYWISIIFPTNGFFFLLSTRLIFFSNFLFVLTLSLRWLFSHYFPLSNLYESLIFLAWGISTCHLILEKKTNSRVLGAIISPILFFLSSFSSLALPIDLQKASPLVPSLQSNWLMMHVSMMMISYATLLIGSLLSIFYFSLELFKKKKIEPLFKTDIFLVENNSRDFQLLDLFDIWSYRIIGIGFPFLTLGIISGAVWANEAWGSYWSWDPKETWAFITWIVFATYLHSRLIKGWKGTNSAILGSLGFFIIWICYLGVNFLGKGLHSYGWILNSNFLN